MASNSSIGGDSAESDSEAHPLPLMITQAVTLSGIIIVGTVANGIICNCIIRKKNVVLVTNTFVFNLAATDFLLCVLCMPFALVSSVTRHWVFGDAMCVIAGFLLTVLRIASILALALVAIDRYLAIDHPLKYCTMVTRRTSIFMVGFAWCQAVVCAVLPAAGWGKGYGYFKEESICRPRLASPVDDDGFTVFLFVTCFLIPFSVIGFTHISILLTARKQFRQVHHARIPPSLLINVQSTTNCRQPSLVRTQRLNARAPSAAIADEITSATNGMTPRIRRRKIGGRQKARGFKVLLVIVVFFLVCLCPHFILLFVSSLYNISLPLALRAMTTWLTFLNSACNPFLYGFFNSKFRANLMRFLDQRVLCCKWKHNTEASPAFRIG